MAASGHAINNQGQITGAMYTEAGKLQAYVYDLASNQLTVLASENHGIGWDINDDGIVVGEVGTPGAAISQGGSMVSIGSLSPGQSAIAYGINSSGRVAGYSHLPASPHLAAFVYASGVMTRLDTVTSPGGWQLDGVTAINASHWMVALGRDPRGDFTSALVTPEGVVPPHAQHPLAIDISDIARAVVMILFGVTQDGGGAYIGADGKLHHIGPGPGDPPPFWQQLSAAQRDLLIAAAVNRLARGIDDTAGRSRIEAAAAKLIRDLTPQIAARTLSESRGPRSATPHRGRFDPRRRQQEALRAPPAASTPRS
jgi:hypothetical protein